MAEEQWRPGVGYEGLYEISDQGRVRSLARVVPHSRHHQHRVRERILRPATQRRGGYQYVGLSCEGHQSRHYIHVLMREAFDD